MKEIKIKKIRKLRRLSRIRNKILAKKTFPRLTVFRSNRYIYAQIIDDKKGLTLVAVSEKEIEDSTPIQSGSKMKKIEKAKIVGQKLAQKAKTKKIKNVVYDKGAYKYHGRIKALAEGAREGGLVF